MSTNKPVIGITLDFETTDSYSKYPWYALRENYFTAVTKFGGIPLPLPHFPEHVDYYFSLIDGLLITGGNFDVDPKYYGQEITSDRVSTKDKRTKFEIGICRLAMEKKMPILGICGGEQLINVVMGGTLIQHIPDTIKNPLKHEQTQPKHIPTHQVNLNQDSLLYKITGNSEFHVNTTHHQAVDKLGKGFITSATAPDGVIEAIENPEMPFCLGVEWHPEYLTTPEDNLIFEQFIKACA
ncbi:MAG: gamma-glutamyl-gamma-aminobutyrate hydrolase family protein [Rickettsiales bacterium]